MGSLMKACVLHQPGPVRERPLRFEDVETPAPTDGHLLIRVRACGVCRTGLHVVEGELPSRRTPLIPGHQVVGTVEATGERVGVAELVRNNTGRQIDGDGECRARIEVSGNVAKGVEAIAAIDGVVTFAPFQ